MTELKPTPLDGKCPDCGKADLLLAQDMTEYSTVNLEDGELVATYSGMESSQTDDAVRLYCAQCGTRFVVPEDLP